MKAFKRYSAARKAANGEPIIRIGDLYLVGVTVADGYMTEVSLISPEGRITGNITMRHLDRLGNGNWATSGDNRDPMNKIWRKS